MTRPDFKPRRAAADNDAIRQMARSVAEGTPFERPAPGAGQGPGTGQGPGSDARPAPEAAKKATFDFPLSLHRALQLAAVEKGVTMRHIVLQALADAGHPVAPAALVPDRRSRHDPAA